MDKMWAGRFSKALDKEADDFNSSLHFDCKMFKQDIQGSIAHAQMLAKQGIITKNDCEEIIDGLSSILDDIIAGKLTFDSDAEDIHMFIESELTARKGDVGKRLHTARSRNDQVAVDIRLFLRDEAEKVNDLLYTLIEAIVNKAEENQDAILPGYTHLQRAQPITFAHHVLAYVEMLKRDYDRLESTYKHTNVMPLGSGALAGTTYPLDRQMVCDALGFDSITLNSLDGVSDRDFCIELLNALSILMMHLSRFCEEIILWSSHEFKFVELDDAYSTGSSIMPQKKNPDMAELIRGKTGRVYGYLMGLLTTMKGLPLAYNKDMQEDKEGVFAAIDTVKMCLPVFTNMVNTMTVRKQNMYEATKGGFTNATDAADWLVKQGVPFRDAHAIIGQLVLYCINNNTNLDDLSLEEYKAISPVFDETVYDAIRVEKCVEARNIIGGPSKEYIENLIKTNEEYFETL